jgi:uncharacterized protein YecT (DUF1311 family)
MPKRFSSVSAIAAAAATVGVSVALAIAAPAGASSAHATTLAAPVIHEPFTAMPCTGKPGNRNTLQLEACSERQILRSDKQIDALNKKIFSALPSDSARRDLIAGHKAWLAYRKSYCLSASDVFQGGTLAGVVDANCVATLNGQHVTNLKSFLKELSANG